MSLVEVDSKIYIFDGVDFNSDMAKISWGNFLLDNNIFIHDTNLCVFKF